jgi:Ca2+-binding EF-hand superfamily protein
MCAEGGQDSGSPEKRRLSARELLELRNAFTDIDTDESGYITAAEVGGRAANSDVPNFRSQLTVAHAACATARRNF